jgi:hypothetical protein
MGDKDTSKVGPKTQRPNRPKPKNRSAKGPAAPKGITVSHVPKPKIDKSSRATTNDAAIIRGYFDHLINSELPIFLGKKPATIHYLKPYEKQLDELATKLGVKGKDNLDRIKEILGMCAERIQDENHDFLVLSLAVMLVESHWDHKAVSRVGATGLMQIMPQTAVEIMLRMEPKILYGLGITPWSKLFVKLTEIKDIDTKTRFLKPGEEAKAREYRQAYKIALKEAAGLVNDEKLLFKPTVNMGIGIFYLSSLLERFKPQKGKRIGDQALIRAIASYNAGPRPFVIRAVNQAFKRSGGQINDTFYLNLPSQYTETWDYIKKIITAFHLVKNNPEKVSSLTK